MTVVKEKKGEGVGEVIRLNGSISSRKKSKKKQHLSLLENTWLLLNFLTCFCWFCNIIKQYRQKKNTDKILTDKKVKKEVKKNSRI